MNPDRTPIPERRRRAVLDRDAAIARVRRATTATLALATALVAAFAGLAATSTHHSGKTVKATAKKSNATTTVQTPSVSPPALQQSESSPAPPAQAPAPSPSPPAAVSGGS